MALLENGKLELNIMWTESAILRNAREKLGLTQHQVAERAKVQLRQYQRLESGERNLSSSSFSIASRVLAALEIDINGFIQGDYVLSEKINSFEEAKELTRPKSDGEIGAVKPSSSNQDTKPFKFVRRNED